MAENNKEVHESTIEMFRAELWYESKPQIDFEGLRTQVEARAGTIEIITEEENLTTWAFRNYTTDYDDTKSL